MNYEKNLNLFLACKHITMNSNGRKIFDFMVGPSGFTRMAVLHINKTYYIFKWM